MKPKGYYFSIIFFPALILGLIMGYSAIFVSLGLIGGGILEWFKRKGGEAPQMSDKEKKHNRIAWWVIIAFLLFVLIVFLIQIVF